MWLNEVEAVWDSLPVDRLRGTQLALRLLRRTQMLLGDGEHWRADPLATTAEGHPCNPLSHNAQSFNLAGAAALARWEMREELAASEISPVHMQQVMKAIFAVAQEYRGEGGWSFTNAILDGMCGALEEYRDEQLVEVRQHAA